MYYIFFQINTTPPERVYLGYFGIFILRQVVQILVQVVRNGFFGGGLDLQAASTNIHLTKQNLHPCLMFLSKDYTTLFLIVDSHM